MPEPGPPRMKKTWNFTGGGSCFEGEDELVEGDLVVVSSIVRVLEVVSSVGSFLGIFFLDSWRVR